MAGFWRRHRRKLAVALGLVGASYWIAQYVISKLREMQERLVLERLTKDNLERRFEQNQKDASFTILALYPTLSTQIMDKYNVEAVKQQLQMLRSAPKTLEGSVDSLGASASSAGSISGANGDSSDTKSKLWEDIKVLSITRVFTLAYSAALLTVLTRIQLNLLGRRDYVASVKPQPYADEIENLEVVDTNRQFLTFSWWLLNRGWESIASRVQGAVEDATADVDARTSLTQDQLSELIGRVQYSVDHTSRGSKSWLGAALPPVELETYILDQMPRSPTGTTEISKPSDITGDLRNYLDETADVLESPNVADVMQRLVHAALVVLMDRMTPLYAETESVRLASALAVFTRQAHQLAAGSPMTNDYIDAMTCVPELDALCAVIYSNY